MSIIEQYRDLVKKDKRTFLDFLNNIQPYTTKDGNLEVSTLTTEYSSKWLSWWTVRDNPWQLSRINQRTIGTAEVVFDLDPHKDETADSFQQRIDVTIAKIEAEGVMHLGTFSTGSRGVHIHTLLPDLITRDLPKIHRIKQHFLLKYDADPQKATLHSMIALEGAPHWKTGVTKVLR